MRQKNIELHIEELVLHGFALGDRYSISDAVERELMWLFADRGVPQALSESGEIEHINGGTFDLERDSKPEAIGIKVAQALYGGLNQ